MYRKCFELKTFLFVMRRHFNRLEKKQTPTKVQEIMRSENAQICDGASVLPEVPIKQKSEEIFREAEANGDLKCCRRGLFRSLVIFFQGSCNFS